MPYLILIDQSACQRYRAIILQSVFECDEFFDYSAIRFNIAQHGVKIIRRLSCGFIMSVKM